MDHPLLDGSTPTNNSWDDIQSKRFKPETRRNVQSNHSLSTTPTKEARNGPKLLLVACVILHTGLIIAHAVLVAVYSRHYEHALSVSADTSTKFKLHTVVTVISQTIGTLYTAILVLVTQKLALQRDLCTRQTLTSIHDKSSAWLGLGSSLQSLWYQTKLRAATWGVTLVTGYLMGIFILHITIPSLFDMVPFNATVPTTQGTQLAFQNFVLGGDSFGIYDILAFYGAYPSIGLFDNMVYDIIPVVPNAIGDVTVNGTLIGVDCSAVPTAQQTGFQLVNSSASSESIQAFYNFTVQTDRGPIVIQTTLPEDDTLRVAPTDTSNAFPCIFPTDITNRCYPYPFMIVSAIPIVDSTGTQGPMVAIDPPILSDLPSPGEPNNVIRSIQVLACDVHTQNMTLDVSAQTQLLVSSVPSSSDGTWKNWTAPANDSLLSDPLAAWAQYLPSIAPLPAQVITPTYPVYVSTDNSTQNATITFGEFTIFDQFLLETLSVISSGDNGVGSDPDVTLKDLNDKLAMAITAVYWYTATFRNNTVLGDVVPFGRLQGQSIVDTGVIKVHLELSLVPLIIGFVTSLVLLAISLALTRQPASADTTAVIDRAGPLQFSWLYGSEPHLSRVEDTGIHTLRKAGMFEIQMSELARQKLARGLEGGNTRAEVEGTGYYELDELVDSSTRGRR